MDSVKEVWGFAIGTFLVRYLGVPLSPKNLKMNEYDGLIKRMTEKIQS